MESVRDFLRRKAQGQQPQNSVKEDPVGAFLRQKASADDSGEYTPGVGRTTVVPQPSTNRDRITLSHGSRFERQENESALRQAAQRNVFQQAAGVLARASEQAAMDRITSDMNSFQTKVDQLHSIIETGSPEMSMRAREQLKALQPYYNRVYSAYQAAQGIQPTNVTEEQVREASAALDTARGNALGASLRLGSALTARGQNPLSDNIPELQTAVQRAKEESTAAHAAEQEAAARYNQLASDLQYQTYASLRMRDDFLLNSFGDAETARKAAGSTDLADIYYARIYGRNHDTEKPDSLAGDIYRYVNDDEASTFFYLWNTRGKKAATDYLANIKYKIDERLAQQQEERLNKLTESDFGAAYASAASVLLNQGSIAGVVDLTLQNIRRMLGDNRPIDYNTQAQAIGKAAQQIRSNVSKNLEEKHPNATLFGGAINAASFLYQAGMSMADSGLQLVMNRFGVPEPVTLSLMAGGAAQQAVYNAKERGASDGAALLTGYAAGIVEYVTEKVSLDKLVGSIEAQAGATIGEKLTQNWATGTGFQRFIRNFASGIINAGKQGGTELTEEAFATIANTFIDLALNGDKSELVQNMEAVGAKQALKNWATQLLADAMAGFISGFGMGGTGEVVRGINNRGQVAQPNRTDVTERDAPAVIEEPQQIEAFAPAPATALQTAIDKLVAGEPLTQNDAKRIMQNAEAMQTLRDAGVLPENVRNDSAGRQIVRQAVEQYVRQQAAQEAPQTAQETPEAREGSSTAPANQTNTPPLPPAAEANTPGLRLGGETERPPVPSRVQDAAQDAGGTARESGGTAPGSKTIQKALAQERTKDAGKAQSLRDVGFNTASEDATVKIRTEDSWDAEEKAVGQALRDLGYDPTFTTGIIHNAEGDSVPFLLEGNKLAIRADHRTQSIQQIAEKAVGQELNIDTGARNRAVEDINRAREAQRAQAAEANKPKASARAQRALDSAREAGASQESGELAARLADALDRDIVFYNEAGKDGANTNGYTKDGVLYINAGANVRTVAWVVGHELTHNMEDSRYYKALRKLAMRELGLNWNQKVQSKIQTAERVAQKLGNDSIKLDPDGAEREVVADFFADRLLSDEASIRAVCEYEPVTARNIRDYIKQLLKKIGGKEATLERAVTLYNKALKDVAQKAQANAAGKLRLGGTQQTVTRENGLKLGGTKRNSAETVKKYSLNVDTVDYAIKYTAKNEQSKNQLNLLKNDTVELANIQNQINKAMGGRSAKNIHDLNDYLNEHRDVWQRLWDMQQELNEAGIRCEFVTEPGNTYTIDGKEVPGGLIGLPIKYVESTTGKRYKFTAFWRNMPQMFLDSMSHESREKLRTEVMKGVEDAYARRTGETDLLPYFKDQFPTEREINKVAGERTIKNIRNQTQDRVQAPIRDAEKTVAALNLNSACPMFTIGNNGCYLDACYLTQMANGATGTNLFRSAWYTGELLQISDADIRRMNELGGLRINGVGDTTLDNKSQLKDAIRHAGMRDLKVKMITKQRASLEVLEELHNAGVDVSHVTVQPSMDNLWIPAGLDDVYGAGVRGNTQLADTVKAGNLEAAASGYEEMFGRATKIVDGTLYRKYGFTPEQIQQMKEDFPFVQITPRYVVCTAAEIAEIALNRNGEYVNGGKLIQTLMHGKVPQGCLSDYPGELINFGGARHVVERKDGKWHFYGEYIGKGGQVGKIIDGPNTPYGKVQAYVEQNYTKAEQDKIWLTLKNQMCCQANDFKDACAGCQSLCARGCAAFSSEDFDYSKFSLRDKAEAMEMDEAVPMSKPRYSVDDADTYNRTALITEDTVDKWLKDYAAKSSPKYAQAYITRMTPKQFVDLTTSTTGRLLIGNQTEALDAEKLIEATRDQPMQIQISDGEVVGHEGRHRATALSRAGVDSIPVLVFDYINKYSKTDVPEMTLQGQDFGHSRSYATETLRDLIPLSYENRDRIVQEYGTQPASERLQEKYSGRKTVQFSAEDAQDSDDEYRQAPGTEALDKLGIRLAGSKGKYHLAEQLLERDKAAKELMKATKKAEKKLKATKAEREFASGIAAGVYEERDIPSSMNKDTVTTLADYYAAEEGFKTNMLAEVRGRINAEYQDEAEELLGDVENFKKLSMLSLNERTPDRTFRAMFGPKQGKAIFDWLIRPVQMNEAAKTRWHQEQLDKVRTFADSKGKTRALTRAESELTMLVMEGKAAAAAVADMEKKGLDAKGIRNAAENIRNGEDAADAAWEFGLKDKEREIAKNYARWMDTQEKLKSADSTIIENAAEAYSKIFDEYYDAINDFLVAHGYEPIGYIKGYAPHMQPEETQNLLEKAFDKMGISLGNDKAQGLPASIAGETAFFKPNKRWDPYFLHRTGNQAEYDIEKAYQSYVGYLSDILFHTDDIMRVRNMERMIRKNSAPDDISETIDHIREIRSAPSEDRLSLLRDAGRIGKTTMLSPAEISEKLDEWEEEQFNSLKEDRNYNNLVMWLSNYANILAGKQSFADRGWEYSLGRNSLNFANRLQAAFQRSLVAGSLTSAMNQTAQLPMIKAELGDRWYYTALKDIITGQTKGFWKDSDFLTGKHGVDMLYTDNYEKFISALFKPSTVVDNIVSTTAVRGAFLKAIHQGQSYSEAMQTADDFGRRVMGSREKGTRPLAYESKGLFSRMIHMFQVEAANSWDHIVSDLPYEIKEIARTQGKPKAARTLAALLVKALLSTFLLNRLTEETYGGTPAPFDVIGLAMNFVASGQGMTTNQYLKTIIDNGLEKIGSDRFFGTEDVDTEFDVGKGLEELGYNVMNDVPLLRNLAGVLGLGDQTVPLPGAGGEFTDLVTSVGDLIDEGADKQEIENALRAFGKMIMQFAPAGRQITKTVEGVEAAIRGGSYNKKGNLQYPIDDTADKVKAILFGKNATNAAQEHWASGEGTMSEKQTGMVAKLRGQGMTGAEAQNAARTVKSFSGDDKRDQTVAYIDSLNITDSLKDEMYFYAGYKESTLDNTPWHNRGGSSGRGKTYAPGKLRLGTPERRAPVSGGLTLGRGETQPRRSSGLTLGK